MHASHARSHNLLSITVAVLFLVGSATAYGAVGATVHPLAQELHILFILTILAGLLFLLYAILRPRLKRRRKELRRQERMRVRAQRVAMASRPATENAFYAVPERPIRVNVGSDDGVGVAMGMDVIREEEGEAVEARGPEMMQRVESVEAGAIKPPQYGMWRSSVVSPCLPPCICHRSLAVGKSVAVAVVAVVAVINPPFRPIYIHTFPMHLT